MASLKFYLDKRYKAAKYSLKIAISHHSQTACINLGIKIAPEQWNERAQRIVGHPNRNAYNNMIDAKMCSAERALLALQETGEWRTLTVTQLKERIERLMSGDKSDTTLPAYFRTYAERANRPNTRALYLSTLSKMEAFDRRRNDLTFDAITNDWLTSFRKWMEGGGLSVNAVSIHLRNVRAVVNSAIDDGLTDTYAFRRFKIKSEKTDKRSLSVEQLRTLFAAQVEPWQQPYLDAFKLIFFLVGINVGDLCNLKAMKGDRVVYHRAKTNSLLRIKVEPEAMEIIERYRGDKFLLNYIERHNSYIAFSHQFNRVIKTLVPGEPFNELSTYWARHSWATIAASLDIPKETIAHALGHVSDYSGVTDTYIRFDDTKVDEANRKVIDHVLGIQG